MSVVSFLLGFVIGLGLAALTLALIYRGLRKRRAGAPDIKGYLDLIPDLTPQQRGQVQDIRRVFLPAVESIRGNLRENRAKLARLLFEEPHDREAIYEVADRIAAHQAELEHDVIEHILEEKELLTSPQRRRFYDIIVQQFAAGGLGVHDVKGRRPE